MNNSPIWLKAFRFAHRFFAQLARSSRTPLFGMLCALTLYYAFVVSAGRFGVRDWNMDYYDQLAEGFRAGHLYLPTMPKPELLARANPYTYENVKEWDAWLWDASLYNGHYYIYWGPVPALLLWLFKAALGITRTIHDQWLVLFFSLMRLYAGTALIVQFARDHNPRLPRWALYLAVLVFGLASPTPYFLARPLVYEACIAAGQGLLCLGLYFAYRGLTTPLSQLRWFVAAGSCFGCALAARASLIITVPLVIAATAWCAVRTAGYPLRKTFAALLGLGVPVASSLAAYAVYNYMRFDAFEEFGIKYQLSGRPYDTADRYILPNLVSYIGSELDWSCKFPFVRLPEQRDLTSLINWAGDYDSGQGENGERVGGVLVASVISWLWVVWLWRAYAWAKRKYAQRRVRLCVPAAFSNRELWLVLCSLAMIASTAPASRLYLASMRYLEDAASGMLFGAIAAGFWLLRPVPDHAHKRAVVHRLLGPALYGSLALHTVFVGVCLGFTGHTESFRRENLPLFGQLEHKLSVCGIKQRLGRLKLHALQSFESDANYVACTDATHFVSRNSCQERPTARP